jgi:AcrR family transcriptional regulator
MALLKHRGNNPLKIKQIIDTAQKHFAMYGFEKTSMRGIALDLHASKASLYYYFPDKEHLYKAIVLKENDLYMMALQNEIQPADDPIDALRKFAKIRIDLFRTLINLSRSRLEALSGITPFMYATNVNLRLQEMDIIKGIFTKGIEIGLFSMTDTEEIADLFIELLKGLRTSILKGKTFYYLDAEEYNLLEKRTLRFVDVFTKGIKV